MIPSFPAAALPANRLHVHPRYKEISYFLPSPAPLKSPVPASLNNKLFSARHLSFHESKALWHFVDEWKSQPGSAAEHSDFFSGISGSFSGILSAEDSFSEALPFHMPRIISYCYCCVLFLPTPPFPSKISVPAQTHIFCLVSFFQAPITSPLPLYSPGYPPALFLTFLSFPVLS